MTSMKWVVCCTLELDGIFFAFSDWVGMAL